MVARLAFSIATQVDPEILIVDEILSVGDLNFQQKSEAKMRSMITGGTTVLYVSHSIDSIRSLCDKVVWLDHWKSCDEREYRKRFVRLIMTVRFQNNHSMVRIKGETDD